MYKLRVGPTFARAAHVVYVDLRGHGASDRSPPERLTLDTWADDVRALCDALGIERPVVLGQGFGAFVAARYAGRHPDHPRALVLAAAVARNVPSRSVAVFDRLGGAEVGEAARRWWDEPDDREFGEYLRLCVPHTIATEVLADAVARVEWDVDVALHWARGETRTVDTRPDLARIRCPTLVLAGDDDPASPLAGVEEVAAAVPPEHLAGFHVYPGARHSLFRDEPESAVRLLEFIEALERQPA
jgi:proline iminopeptidase